MSYQPSLDERYAFLTAKLRQCREESGLTQLQVANLLGKPQSYIAKIELGERRLDIIELQLLAEIYGTEINLFLMDIK